MGGWRRQMTAMPREGQVRQIHERGFVCSVPVMPVADAPCYNRGVFSVWRNSKRLTKRGSLMYY